MHREKRRDLTKEFAIGLIGFYCGTWGRVGMKDPVFHVFEVALVKEKRTHI